MLVENPEQRTLKPDPLERPDYVEADIQAVRAVARGEATHSQQTRSIEYLINFVCCTYDQPFRSSGDRETALACGKQLVGQHLLWLLKTAPTKTSVDAIAAQPREERE